MNPRSVAALGDAISGEVARPGDATYERLRNSFVHPGSPELIVLCQDNDDVRAAIKFARDNELTVSVRSGGHSNAGFSTNDGGIVIDLSKMDGVEILCHDDKVVRLGSGAHWGDVAARLSEHNLAFSSGDTTSVGVGGLLLGGGIGWMVRRYGLAIDSVVGAEIVTADGRVLRASADENPELFWAIRGGGGNFGVVTSFDVVAKPNDGVFFGQIMFPAAETKAVLKGWAEYMRTAPEGLTTAINLFPGFGGERPPVIIVVCYGDSDADAAQAAIAPLLALGTLESNDIAPVPYRNVLVDADELPEGWQPRVRSAFVEDVSPAFIDTLIDDAVTFDTLFIEFRSLGGQVRATAADATAFAHRDVEAMINLVHLGTPDDNLAAKPAFDALLAKIAPYTTGAYSNFLSEVGADEIAAVYPTDTLKRLVAVKTEYDPTNLFSRNPNIPPSAQGADQS